MNEKTTFKATFSARAPTFRASFDSFIDAGGSAVPPYTGEYSVTPQLEAVSLPTKGKRMTDDLSVEAIPVASVSNPSGGRTIIIG